MKAAFWLWLLIASLIVLCAAPHALTQQPASTEALSYRTFSGLATIYQQDGQSPQLVAELNQALGLMDEAHVKLLQGNDADATKLEGQANSILTDVLNQTPAAQQTAANDRTWRILTTVSLIPLAVLLSTLLFYISLRVWRRYEKSRLFEKRIIRVVHDEVKD